MAESKTHITVTRDNYLIDGQEVVDAARAEGRHTVPAYILEIDWETATPDERRRLRELGGVLNPVKVDIWLQPPTT